MHCSLWRFVGDPDELGRRYLALMAEIPESNHVLHVCAKTPDGLLVFDTCPSEEQCRAFFDANGPAIRAGRRRVGRSGGCAAVGPSQHRRPGRRRPDRHSTSGGRSCTYPAAS